MSTLIWQPTVYICMHFNFLIPFLVSKKLRLFWSRILEETSAVLVENTQFEDSRILNIRLLTIDVCACVSVISVFFFFFFFFFFKIISGNPNLVVLIYIVLWCRLKCFIQICKFDRKFFDCFGPTSGGVVLRSILVDGRCQVQFPISLVDLAIRSYQLLWFSPKLA